MDQQKALLCSCKGKDKHQSIIESEGPHVMISPESTLTIREIFVTFKQTTFVAFNVFDNVLVATVIYSVNNRVAISRVKSPNTLSSLLWDWCKTVINSKAEERLFSYLVNSKRFK